MKKIYYVIALFISMIALSCTNNVDEIQTDNITENKVASFEDYFEFLNTETDGSVIVQSISTPLANETFKATSSIKGNKMPVTLKVENKIVSFTNYNYSETTNKSYSNVNLDDMSEIFGGTFEMELNSNQLVVNKNSSPSNSVESVYIPNLIQVQFSGLQNGKIIEGSQISWNSDSDNENGVVLGIEYNPLSQLEESIVTQKSDRLLKGVTLVDNGSYTISQQDLIDYPSNAMLTFYIGRAGYSITSDGAKDYSLAGLTVSRADFKIQK